MCQYGNCNETMTSSDYKLIVSEANRGSVTDRAIYCCLEHAWRHLKEKDERLNGKRGDL
jgi:hypothetical protein